MNSRAAAIVVISTVLTACGAPNVEDLGGSLAGREFLSTRLVEGGAERQLVPGTRVRITFSAGSIGASVGCAPMGGAYQFLDGRLVIDELDIGGVGCSELLHTQDQWLIGLLTSRPSVALAGAQLVIAGGATELTLLEGGPAEPDLPLVGTAWVLTGLIEDDAARSVPIGVEAAMRLGADGSVSIEPGCNSGSGAYEVLDDRIVFGDIALTRMGCPGARGETEATVLRLIAGDAVTFRIEADLLTLESEGGTLQFAGR